jgi:hypothetical protein
VYGKRGRAPSTNTVKTESKQKSVRLARFPSPLPYVAVANHDSACYNKKRQITFFIVIQDCVGKLWKNHFRNETLDRRFFSCE